MTGGVCWGRGEGGRDGFSRSAAHLSRPAPPLGLQCLCTTGEANGGRGQGHRATRRLPSTPGRGGGRVPRHPRPGLAGRIRFGPADPALPALLRPLWPYRPGHARSAPAPSAVRPDRTGPGRRRVPHASRSRMLKSLPKTRPGIAQWRGRRAGSRGAAGPRACGGGRRTCPLTPSRAAAAAAASCGRRRCARRQGDAERGNRKGVAGRHAEKLADPATWKVTNPKPRERPE